MKSTYTCVSNVLSSISKYANDSFKENSHEEHEAFVETLVAVFVELENNGLYEGGGGKNCETFSHIPDEPSKLRNFSPSKLLSFTVPSSGEVFCLSLSASQVVPTLKLHFHLPPELSPE